MKARRFLISLAGAALLALATAFPAQAADFKYTGIFRVRGITADDLDRDDGINSGFQYMDVLVRPRFTATSEGGKLWSIYELDYNNAANGGSNHIFGSTTSDDSVGVNRWLIDFAIPGTTLRARAGRTDYTDPTNEIFDSNGLQRQDGIGLYGKLAGPFSLSAFTVKLAEGLTAATDADNYYVALKWQAAPQIAITPWVALSRRNGTTSATDYSRYFYALHGQAKVGILDIELQGIYQDGTAAEPPAGGRDTDLEAWAFMLRSWLTFGKAKVGFYLTYLTGEDNPDDNEFKGFVFPTQSGALDIPNILSGRRYSTITRSNAATTNNIFSNAAFQGTGSCSATSCRPNGMLIPELLVKYEINPSLLVEGSVSLVRSDEKITSAGFTNDKDFGTIVEAAVRWNIYKQLALWVFGSYIFAGDYGSRQDGSFSPDNSWAVYYEFRHTW